MDCIDIGNVENIRQNLSLYWHYNDELVLPPMFHGTDESLLKCSDQERDRLNCACETIIYSICDLLHDNSISEADNRLLESKDSYSNSAEALFAAKARMNGSKRYNYGDFYVSSDPSIAISYSNEAWIYGETGQIANRLVESVNVLGLALPNNDSFRDAFELFIQRKKEHKKPIVLMLIGCRAKDICSLEGVDLYEKNPDLLSLYVKGLKEKCMTDSYRLKKDAFDSDMKILTVNSQLYDGLVKAWNALDPKNTV